MAELAQPCARRNGRTTNAADRKSLLALWGLSPEFEAGSGCFHKRMLACQDLRVDCPIFRDAGARRITKDRGLQAGVHKI
jgi:hypothetical protein